MKRFFMTLSIISFLFLISLLIACGDHDQYRHKPLMQDDGQLNAKDRPAEDQFCEVNEVVIWDCLDACSCCYFGEEQLANQELCVQYCDSFLMLMYNKDVEPRQADYTGYQECILGCVSLCGKREKSNVCINECKIHLGL